MLVNFVLKFLSKENIYRKTCPSLSWKNETMLIRLSLCVSVHRFVEKMDFYEVWSIYVMAMYFMFGFSAVVKTRWERHLMYGSDVMYSQRSAMSMQRQRKRWLGSVENDVKKMGVRGWRKRETPGKWILKEAKVLTRP